MPKHKRNPDPDSISSIQTKLLEINILFESARKLHEDIIRSYSEQSVEIRNINSNIDRIRRYLGKTYDELKKFDRRVSHIETMVENKSYSRDRRGQHNGIWFFETIKEYSHWIALIVALGVFILTTIFGIKFD